MRIRVWVFHMYGKNTVGRAPPTLDPIIAWLQINQYSNVMARYRRARPKKKKKCSSQDKPFSLVFCLILLFSFSNSLSALYSEASIRFFAITLLHHYCWRLLLPSTTKQGKFWTLKVILLLFGIRICNLEGLVSDL